MSFNLRKYNINSSLPDALKTAENRKLARNRLRTTRAKPLSEIIRLPRIESVSDLCGSDNRPSLAREKSSRLPETIQRVPPCGSFNAFRVTERVDYIFAILPRRRKHRSRR